MFNHKIVIIQIFLLIVLYFTGTQHAHLRVRFGQGQSPHSHHFCGVDLRPLSSTNVFNIYAAERTRPTRCVVSARMKTQHIQERRIDDITSHALTGNFLYVGICNSQQSQFSRYLLSNQILQEVHCVVRHIFNLFHHGAAVAPSVRLDCH